MSFYIYKNNEQLGPYEESYVVDAIRQGRFSTSDLACRAGDTQWLPLSSLFPLEARSGDGYPNQPASHQWMKDSANLPPERVQPIAQPPPNMGNYQAPFQPQQQVHHVVVQQAASPYGTPAPTSSLPIVAMSLGIFTMCLMLIGLIPCFGWVNWMTLAVGGVSNILCWVSVVTEKNPESRNKAVIGLVLTFIALFVGSIRLVLGAGCV